MRSIAEEPPDELAIDEAARIAHGLAGLAAMYGFAEAKVLALEVERCFRRGSVGAHLVLLVDELEAALAGPYRSQAERGAAARR